MLNLKGKDFGRYHLIEPLGEGGMAMVYKAYDANLDRNVAIKVIRTEMGSDPSFLARFQREARSLARLDHPYILKVLDYGEQDGIPYLVMPFVSGGTLKARMGKPIPATETARILAPVARALAYAHQQGIIHRDVKPANILITTTGEPILSDFGIAKLLEAEGQNQLTATGVGMGTPDYMAPEQWMGTTDARTDVYSLGVILFQMVTGRLPYSAETPAAVLLKHMQDPLPRPGDYVPGLADAVERVIFKALAKDPAERFQTMDAFADALEKIPLGAAQAPDVTLAAPPRGTALAATAQPGAQPPVSAPAAPGRSRAPWLAIGGGVVVMLAVLCVAVVAVFFLLRANRQKTNLTPTLSVVEVVPVATTEAPVAAPTVTLIDAAEATPAAESTPTPGPTEAPTIEPTETKLPPLTKIEGLPEDIPLLKENNGDLIKQEGDQMKIWMYSTPLSAKDAAEFFHTEMLKLGWKIQNTTTMEAEGAVMYFFVKGERTAMVSVSTQDEGTMVQVMLQSQ